MKTMNKYPEFYVNEGGYEEVWRGQSFTIVRNGEMRINYPDGVIRYTDQLLAAGLREDEDVEEVFNGYRDGWEVVDNPWFEIFDSNGEDIEGEVYMDIDEAISRLEELEKENG